MSLSSATAGPGSLFNLLLPTQPLIYVEGDFSGAAMLASSMTFSEVVQAWTNGVYSLDVLTGPFWLCQ